MWYTVLIMLVLDIGGLLLIYVLLRDRVRRAASRDSQIAEIRDEVSRLLVELNRTTDRNIALIEDRIASLNELLSSADKKIGLLRRETEKHDVGTQIYSRLAEGRSRVSGSQATTSHSRREREEAAQPRQERDAMPQPRQERDDAPPEVAVGVAAEKAGSGTAAPLSVELIDVSENRTGRNYLQEPPRREDAAARGAAAKPPDLQQRVLMLHNAGFAASLIASRVGVPLGEVELIIALQQRKGRA